jgi:hypothetical protein
MASHTAPLAVRPSRSSASFSQAPNPEGAEGGSGVDVVDRVATPRGALDAAGASGTIGLRGGRPRPGGSFLSPSESCSSLARPVGAAGPAGTDRTPGAACRARRGAERAALDGVEKVLTEPVAPAASVRLGAGGPLGCPVLAGLPADVFSVPRGSGYGRGHLLVWLCLVLREIFQEPAFDGAGRVTGG